jgi:hypothetical protein
VYNQQVEFNKSLVSLFIISIRLELIGFNWLLSIAKRVDELIWRRSKKEIDSTLKCCVGYDAKPLGGQAYIHISTVGV